MRLTSHVILLFALLCAAIFSDIAETQTDDAPYLYYFSREFNAFVIERADGADRHWLGQGLARENASMIDGPGWSPSGSWIAWTENRFTVEQDHGDNPFVVNADGARRLRGRCRTGGVTPSQAVLELTTLPPGTTLKVHFAHPFEIEGGALATWSPLPQPYFPESIS